MGAQPPSAFHQIWTELGAIAGRQVFIHEEMLRIEWPGGKQLEVPADLDAMEREFKTWRRRTAADREAHSRRAPLHLAGTAAGEAAGTDEPI